MPLNQRFQIRNDYLEVTSDDTFVRNPSAILEMFGLMQEYPQLRGVRATTIRLLGRHHWLIDEEFRQNPRNHRLFLELLRAPAGVTHEFRRMNLYGVLGRYIPAFGRVVGRMQYDLFHAYTVDAHILFVLRNLRRLVLPRFEHELPEMSRLMPSLQRPEIVYLAALFHDIAKGRGGDHSELGGVDAEAFCLEQGLSRYDARLVAWLVRNHLLFSVTAQKKDISDPKVIQGFARVVGDQAHLDYLYLLTVADVRGTNPKLWNSWKASLFAISTSACGVPCAGASRRRWTTRNSSRRPRRTRSSCWPREGACPKSGRASCGAAQRALFPAPHARRDRLAHETAGRSRRRRPVAVRRVRTTPERGGKAVSTYGPHRQQNFARTAALLDQMGLNIVDARITPLGGGLSLDTYLVLEDIGTPIADRHRASADRTAALARAAQAQTPRCTVTRRAPRQVRMFTTPTQISFSEDPLQHRTVLEIIAGDRPGLLSEIGKVFMAEQIDVLHVQDHDGRRARRRRVLCHR